MKGQGNAAYYPNPLVRSPGDIDIWIIPRKYGKPINRINQIVDFVKKTYRINSLEKHHLEYSIDSISVEAHFTPADVFFASDNNALQSYFF